MAVRAATLGGIESIASGNAGGGAGGMSALLMDGKAAKAQKFYALNRDWIYVVISAIARRVAGLPYGAGTIASKDSKGIYVSAKLKAYSPQKLPPTIKQRTANGRAIEQVPSHPALDFLQKPNKLQGKTEFLHTTIANLFLTGEFYWVGGKTQAGKAEVWAVPTSWLTPVHEGGLFTSYKLKVPGTPGEPIPLQPEQVCRGYFPDPAEFKAALSPVSAELRAIRIDEHIQSSQEDAFERGPIPQLAVTIGDKIGADGQSLGPPVLTGVQRAQIIRAIREIWRVQSRNGDPAILDGFIKEIHKLQTANNEMDWLQSGEAVKKRIFQAFGINPIVVGEVTGANRAQAAVADQNFVDNVINPLVDQISTCLQTFIAPMFDSDNNENSGLALWLEEAKPKDEELEIRKISQARQGGSASRNEERTALGMAPIDSDSANLVGLAATASGAAAVQSLIVSVVQGLMPRESAQLLMVLIYGLSEDQANQLLAKAKPMPQQPPGFPPGAGGGGGSPPAAGPPPGPKKPPKEDSTPPEGEDTPPAPDVGSQGGDNGKAIAGRKSRVPTLTRSIVKSHNVALRERLESEAAVGLTPFFDRSSKLHLNALLCAADSSRTRTRQSSKPPALPSGSSTPVSTMMS